MSLLSYEQLYEYCKEKGKYELLAGVYAEQSSTLRHGFTFYRIKITPTETKYVPFAECDERTITIFKNAPQTVLSTLFGIYADVICDKNGGYRWQWHTLFSDETLLCGLPVKLHNGIFIEGDGSTQQGCLIDFSDKTLVLSMIASVRKMFPTEEKIKGLPPLILTETDPFKIINILARVDANNLESIRPLLACIRQHLYIKAPMASKKDWLSGYDLFIKDFLKQHEDSLWV